MRHLMRYLAYLMTIVATAIFPKFTWGMIYFNDGVYPELATSGRALAMGNAYMSKVDDSMAVWYNPAGLGTVRRPRLHMSSMHLEINKGWLDTVGKRFSSGIFDSFKIDGVRELLEKNPGQTFFGRLHLMPNFTGRYFTLGYLYSKRTKARLSSTDNAQFEYAKRTDHGPYLGLNISLFGGVFKVGGSAILLKRREVFGESDPSQKIVIGANGAPNWDSGKMFLTTAGVRLTFPWVLLPTISAKLNNSASRRFKEKSGSGAMAPTEILQSLDTSFSITPQLSNTTRLHMEIIYRDSGKEYPSDIDQPMAVTTARRWGFGMELDFSRSVFIRFGYGDGFGSGGIGVKARTFECDLTTYAVDTTSHSFRGEEDRRFAFSFSKGI